mmetsp:Transcript_18287/g.33987  ORF Transcript_18287/g.33987 Transcript_18287/m.33987 type:complete len:104 (-) Transcript_18287:311-622(-)
MSVAFATKYIKNALIKIQHSDIKGSSTKIKHQDILIFNAIALIKPISNSCRCGFIDNSFNSQAGNPSSIFSCLPLRLIEICRDCHNSTFDLFSKVRLGRCLHF